MANPWIPYAALKAAGRLLPATVASSALAAGLLALEAYKLATTTCYAPSSATSSPPPASSPPLVRNTYANLATGGVSPQLVSCCPQACKVLVTQRGIPGTGLPPLSWTLWDRLEIDGRGLTLQGLLDAFRTRFGFEPTMVSCGKGLLWADFLNKKKMAERLGQLLPDAVAGFTKEALRTRYITLAIGASDEQGGDADLPDLRVWL